MPGATEELTPIILDPRGDIFLTVGQNHEGNEQPVTLQCCSRTLARTSPVFSRMLYGSFAESKPSQDLASTTERWTVDLTEDNPIAFTLFARIAHGQLDNISHVLAVDTLYELTTLTHYYDATQLLTPWTDRWMQYALEQGQEDTSLWEHKILWISWELKRGRVFEGMARRILMECPYSACAEDSPVMDLQMPPGIVGM